MSQKDLLSQLEELPAHFSPKKKYLLGVSGGRDSVVLLDILHRLGYKKLIICHLNHGLRGRASGADAAFIRRLARTYALPLWVEKVPVLKQAKASKQSIETTARHARHAFFAEVAKKERCSRVFLAHHADDQVETILINLFRGSGTRGMRGMQRTSVLRVGRKELLLIRPLLRVWREEIDHYIHTQDLAYREDSSNSSLDFLRNRVRQQLIPEISRLFQRDVRGAVWRAGEISARENDFFTQILDKQEIEGSPLLKTFRVVHPALSRRLVHHWLRQQGVPNVGYREVEKIYVFVNSPEKKGSINLPGNYQLQKKAQRLFLKQLQLPKK